MGPNGVYTITTGDQHKALVEANKDKLVVMKVFAPWCRACKGLEPKFNGIVKDPKYKDMPILWADLTIQGNKDYVKSIGVLALPTIQFYVHGAKYDTFPCGPSKVPILKRKLTQLVEDYVDATSMTVKDPDVLGIPAQVDVLTDQDKSIPMKKKAEGTVVISDKQRAAMREMPYWSDMTDDEFDAVLGKAKELTFQHGSIIMREGNVGRTFYVITEGEVEICQKTSFEDPLTTPPTYLGTVINRLMEGEFFGERALITKEPRAASIRASSKLTKCLTFDKDDFPATCQLSGRSVEQADIVDADEKYGVALKDFTTISDKQITDYSAANQVRGSVNRPGVIRGVDTDDDEVADEDFSSSLSSSSPTAIPSSIPQVAASRTPPQQRSVGLDLNSHAIIPLLMRFRMLRLVGRCFHYIKKNRLRINEDGGRRRRAMLVKRLSPSQHVEFTDAFTMIDIDGDGAVTLTEMRKAMDSVDESITNEDLLQVFQDRGYDSKNDSEDSGVVNGDGGGGDGVNNDDDEQQSMTYQDFMGIMAEADLYYLFRDTFQALDTRDSGFVRAKDLDRVLCGVRDLISDDRKSIIDVEDKDILIDYEQFSQMLLGKALS